MKQRILSVILALVLCIGMVPMTALAAESTREVSTKEEFIAAMRDSSVTTVLIKNDLDLSGAGLFDASNKTIDLGGNTITNKLSDNPCTGNKFYIEPACDNIYALTFGGTNFTIKNGTITSPDRNALYIYAWPYSTDGRVVIDNTNNVVIENITADGGVNAYDSSDVFLRNVTAIGKYSYAVWADLLGNIIIEEGTFTSQNPGTTSLVGTTQNTTYPGSIQIKGGSFTLDKAERPFTNGTVNQPVITGGSFSDTPDLYLAEGYTAYQNPNDQRYYVHETDVHICAESVVKKEATCTEAGLKSCTCICGHLYTEEIPATGHTVVKDAAVPATYTSTGLTEGSHCSVCKAVIVPQQVVPKLVEVKGESAVVTDMAVDNAVESAKKEDGKATVELNVATGTGSGTTVNEVGVSSSSIDKVLEMTKNSDVSDVALKVELTDATVTLDATALQHIAGKANDNSNITISVEKVDGTALNSKQQETVGAFTNPVVITAEVLVDGVAIASESAGGFNGGTVTVAIPFTAAEGTKLSDYTLIYIDDKGKVSIVETTVVDGNLIASLEHLSEYAVVLNTEAKDIIVKQGNITIPGNKDETTKPTKPNKENNPNKNTNVPETGDDLNMVLWIGLMSAACVGIAIDRILNKRKTAKYKH